MGNFFSSKTPPDESGLPTSAFQGAQGITIHNGNFVVAGGSVTQLMNDYERSKSTLDLVPSNNFRAIQLDTFKKRAPRTCIWFLQSELFQGWVNGRGGILWVIGMPGAGKTILTALVIDYLETFAKTSPDISIAFAYCRYSESMSVEEILIALIRQHLERHPALANIINPVFHRHHHENTTPSQPELLALLKEISKQFRVVIYSLDALDEAPIDEQFNLVEAISSVNAHFFITSRPLGLLKTSFPEAAFFDLEAQDSDMRLFIRHIINRSPTFRVLLENNGDREEIVSKVIENSHGMFLHASLQVEALRQCYSLTDLRNTLADFPAEIKDMYIKTMERVTSQRPKHARLAILAILWVLYAHRSLSFKELQTALAYHPVTRTFDFNDVAPEDFLVSLCCGLITVDKETRLVRLVHYTAKEVLKPLLTSEHPQPHSIIAEACIARLSSCNFHVSELETVGDLELAFKGNSLVSYASDHWGFHVLECNEVPNVRGRAIDFIRTCKSFPFVYRFRTTKAEHKLDKLGYLHVAAYYNFPEVLKDSNSKDDVASSLSEARVDINIPTAESHLTPLMLTSYSGHEQALRALLENPDLQVNLTNRFGWTALTVACYKNHAGSVKRLLDAGADADALASDGRTAFMVACHKGNEAAIRQLLDAGTVDINRSKDDGWTALMLAASEGHQGAVKLLLEAPTIRADTVGKDGWSALGLATKHGYSAIRDRLLAVPEVKAKFDEALKSAAQGTRATMGLANLLALGDTDDKRKRRLSLTSSDDGSDDDGDHKRARQLSPPLFLSTPDSEGRQPSGSPPVCAADLMGPTDNGLQGPLPPLTPFQLDMQPPYPMPTPFHLGIPPQNSFRPGVPNVDFSQLNWDTQNLHRYYAPDAQNWVLPPP